MIRIFFPQKVFTWGAACKWLDERGLYKRWDGKNGIFAGIGEDGRFQWQYINDSGPENCEKLERPKWAR